MILTEIRRAFIVLAFFTLLTGIVYPLSVWGVGQALFPSAANGSLIERNGVIIGSALIGQTFSDPRYFWGRPSAAGNGYDANSSSGSNLGPTSKMLIDATTERANTLSAQYEKRNVPIDLVTSSASGLDPHISPQSAYLQVLRVSNARGIKDDDVRNLVRRNIEGRTFGFFGEPRVNVLKLNLALDEMGSTGVSSNVSTDGTRQ